MTERGTYKAHPDYSSGYFAALNAEPKLGEGAPYEAGYEAGLDARQTLRSNGFTQNGDSSFAQTFTINP